MRSASSLQPHDQIAHFRILRPLAAGGMGEVYVAEDRSLDRSVALKILPPELVRHEERVRRFVREAKSASSLNHPSIVTIYEIGQDVVRSASHDEPSSTIHYISMELVSGETLTTKIHQDQLELRTLLGYLAQAADGLAKAHAAGIVHRDLKPGNIMVSDDGFAKILDFGLAKLLEDRISDVESSGPTRTEEGTRAGAVVGTVGYMSPEQIRGGGVDHRSDIFSFGCILYEAATRTRPFAGDSSVETMHKILHDKPAPIEDLNQEAPAQLRRLIRRCLAKSPEQRLQSAKDLAIELREIVDEYDSLPASDRSRSEVSATAMRPRNRKVVLRYAVGAGILLAAVLALVNVLRRGEDLSIALGPKIQVGAVTSRGTVTGLALSPDGRFLAYGLLLEGQRSLHVRQLATGSDVTVLSPPQVRPPQNLAFSRDGNYLYYTMLDPAADNYASLFEIPVLGGAPRKRTYDVDTRVTFSPDGKRYCFRRGVPEKDQELLVVSDLEERDERVLASVTGPVRFGAPAWSPDGKRVAVVEWTSGATLEGSVVTYRLENGQRERVGTNRWHRVGGEGVLAWKPDGRALFLCASDDPILENVQIWRIPYPKGHATRITNDANSYSMISISSDGTTLAANRSQTESNLWIAPSIGSRAVRQITFLPADQGAVRSIDPGPNGRITFEALRNGTVQLYSIREDGSDERLLTEGHHAAANPWFRRVPRRLFYVAAGEDLTPHIWRSDENGENRQQLTSGRGESIDDVSADGRYVLFRRFDFQMALWKVNAEDGQSVRLAPGLIDAASFSPDGSKILHTAKFADDQRGGLIRHVIPSIGGPPLAMPNIPAGSLGLRWSPNGESITFLNQSDLLRNLHRLRLDGGAPEKMTTFTSGRIFPPLQYSPDGRRLLFRRELGDAVDIWATDVDGKNPMPVTDFETGKVHYMEWSSDSRRAYFRYGQVSESAVLIRNFR